MSSYALRISLSYLYIRSSLPLERLGKSYGKQKKTKRRNNSSHYVTRSAFLIPAPERRILTRRPRVVEKLKEEGWAEELETHPSAYAGLKDITGVRVAKPLTERSTSSVCHSKHSLTTCQLGIYSGAQSSLG